LGHQPAGVERTVRGRRGFVGLESGRKVFGRTFLRGNLDWKRKRKREESQGGETI